MTASPFATTPKLAPPDDPRFQLEGPNVVLGRKIGPATTTAVPMGTNGSGRAASAFATTPAPPGDRRNVPITLATSTAMSNFSDQHPGGNNYSNVYTNGGGDRCIVDIADRGINASTKFQITINDISRYFEMLWILDDKKKPGLFLFEIPAPSSFEPKLQEFISSSDNTKSLLLILSIRPFIHQNMKMKEYFVFNASGYVKFNRNCAEVRTGVNPIFHIQTHIVPDEQVQVDVPTMGHVRIKQGEAEFSFPYLDHNVGTTSNGRSTPTSHRSIRQLNDISNTKNKQAENFKMKSGTSWWGDWDEIRSLIQKPAKSLPKKSIRFQETEIQIQETGNVDYTVDSIGTSSGTSLPTSNSAMPKLGANFFSTAWMIQKQRHSVSLTTTRRSHRCTS